MTSDPNMDDLDAKLRKEDSALAKLKVSVTENKEASQELEKSLAELEAVTQKLVEETD